MSVTIQAAAKVNLHLGVGPLRPDGYHELVTVFQGVSLYDTVTVAHGERLTLTLAGLGTEHVPADRSNLVVQAAERLGARLGVDPRVHIHIDKRIPVAGGMAGGSANAAATLVACALQWGHSADDPVLYDVASELGSDVPFALLGGTALGTGRGERLHPLEGPDTAADQGAFHWVFAVAHEGLATPGVFHELDRMRAESGWSADACDDAALNPSRWLTQALTTGDAALLARCLRNDLQAPALRLRPELAALLRTGVAAGALRGLISGSGPTCAFLTAGADEAVRLAAFLSDSTLCRAAYAATGPVPGAVTSLAPGRSGVPSLRTSLGDLNKGAA